MPDIPAAVKTINSVLSIFPIDGVTARTQLKTVLGLLDEPSGFVDITFTDKIGDKVYKVEAHGPSAANAFIKVLEDDVEVDMTSLPGDTQTELTGIITDEFSAVTSGTSEIDVKAES